LEDYALGERLVFLLAVACARDELHLVHAGFDDSGEPRRASPFLKAVLDIFEGKTGRSPNANAVVQDGENKQGKTDLLVRRSPSDVVPLSLAELATPLEARRLAYLRAAASFTAG